jgi:hypothetical protein
MARRGGASALKRSESLLLLDTGSHGSVVISQENDLSSDDQWPMTSDIDVGSHRLFYRPVEQR